MKKKLLNTILNIILIATAVGLILFNILFSLVRVSGNSMFPTYENQDIVLAAKYANIEKDDVIVFYSGKKYASDIYIKRVVAVPNDTVWISDGYLYVNDEKIIDGFELMNDCGIAGEKITLGENEYFVLGDNRNNSKDSRIMGAVDKDRIIGVAK